MILHANIQPPDRGGSGKRLFRFPRCLAPSSAPVSLDARVPNQFLGLAFTDHGIARAALDVSESLDKLCSCAASRTIAPLIFSPPPPWPRLWPCDGNDAGTGCGSLHPAGSPFARQNIQVTEAFVLVESISRQLGLVRWPGVSWKSETKRATGWSPVPHSERDFELFISGFPCCTRHCCP